MIKNSTVMTDRGPAILLSSVGKQQPGFGVGSDSGDDDEDRVVEGRSQKEEARSPIAQMLYARWVMNLRDQRQSFFCWFFPMRMNVY